MTYYAFFLDYGLFLTLLMFGSISHLFHNGHDYDYFTNTSTCSVMQFILFYRSCFVGTASGEELGEKESASQTTWDLFQR